jgi:hypothetical protein
MSDSCYLCGALSDLTLDHVPPANLFPPPRPSNLIKVACCATCNSSYSKDDEAFRLWVSSSIFRSPAGDWIWHNKVLGSTLPRSPKLHENLKRFVGSFDLQHWTRIEAMNPCGLVAPVFQPARRADWKVGVTAKRFMESKKISTDAGIVEMPTFGIPQQRAFRYLTRITKGLLRHFYPDYDYSSDIFRTIPVPPTSRGVQRVQELVPFLIFDERGKGVFRFWRGFATDVANSGIWVYIFYDGACFIVFNSHKNLPFPDEA